MSRRAIYSSLLVALSFSLSCSLSLSFFSLLSPACYISLPLACGYWWHPNIDTKVSFSHADEQPHLSHIYFSHASSPLSPPPPRSAHLLRCFRSALCPVSSWGSFGIGCDSHLHIFASFFFVFFFYSCISRRLNLYLRTCICHFVSASALVLALLICHCLVSAKFCENSALF